MQETNPIRQSVSLTMPVDFNSIAGSEEAQQSFDESLKTQISTTLGIAPGMVQVLCHQRGSVKAEVVLSDVLPEDGSPARSAARLARDLAKACVDDKSVFAATGLKVCASSAEVHGPISHAVLSAVQSSISEQRTQVSAAIATASLSAGRSEVRAIYLLKRILLKVVILCFGTWVEHALKEKQFKIKASKVVQSILSGMVVQFLGAWYKHTKKEIRKRVLMRRIFFRMNNRCMLMILERWYQNTEALKAQRALMRKVLTRMNQRGVSTVLDLWRSNVQERRAHTIITCKIMLR